MWWLALALALANPPDRSIDVLEIANGVIKGLVVTDDGSLVGGFDNGAKQAFVVNVEDWSIHTIDACDATAIELIPTDSDTVEVYIGCESGKVHVWEWGEDESLAALRDADDEKIVVDLEQGEVKALIWDYYGEQLAALAFGGSNKNKLNVNVVDLYNFAANDITDYPVQLYMDSYEDAVINGSTLLVSHGGDDMSTLVMGNTTPAMNTGISPLRADVTQMTASPNGGAYCADEDAGRIVEFLTTSMTFVATLSDLNGPTAVGLSTVKDDEWMLVADNQVEVYEINSGVISATPSEAFSTTGTQDIKDIVIGSDGYSFGGGGQGTLFVFTANPWVDDFEVSPEDAGDGEAVTIGFTIDEDSDWKMYLGGTHLGDGTYLTSGEATAGEEVIASAEVDDSWAEGNNSIYVVATDRDGNQGHGRATATVDNPPPAPSLTSDSVGFANEALDLSFDGISDADLKHYKVYVTVSEFKASDYETGGPKFDGADDLSAPFKVEAEPGDSVSVRIEPLTNDVTYYIAVRAFDDGGLEGPMSDVVTGMPRPTMTAADLAGEEGGLPCSTTPLRVSWLALLSAGLLFLRRRKSVLGPLALLFLLVPASADAAKKEKKWGDSTKSWGDFEIRYGGITLKDDNINTVYGETGNQILQMEFGPQIFRLVELDVGLGFFQELAFTVDEAGAASSERTMMTWYPITADATLRLHFWDEQPIVPFARYGLDYVFWNEKWDNGSGGKDKIFGAKWGTHFAFGGNLLLDIFARGRASLLEAQTGINDTFITVEWRRQKIDNDTGFVFSGDSITVGLKLDF
ncbi:MAG: hypothetical protein HN348_01675 [Proteobacteria bacterium]|nr:hypothetical protein [Pseudomonadota bacterium]